MARYYASPTKKREKSLKEGRGTGHGKNYKPSLQVQEVASHGRSTRIKGQTAAGRTHEMLSDNERSVLLSLDHATGVDDIREQVPLDLKATVAIAARAGIKHPKVKNELSDLTTDFVVDVATSEGPVSAAIAVKSAADLCKKRVIEKLEIERRYWLERGISWQIATDREMLPERKQHDLWIYGWENLDELEEPRDGYWKELKETFLNELMVSSPRTIKSFIKEFDAKYSHTEGHCLAMIRHLIAAKIVRLAGCHFLDVEKATDQLQIYQLN